MTTADVQDVRKEFLGRIQEKVHYITSRETAYLIVGPELALWCTRLLIDNPHIKGKWERYWRQVLANGKVYVPEAGGWAMPEDVFRHWQREFAKYYAQTRWEQANDMPLQLAHNELYPGAGTVRFRDRPDWIWAHPLTIEGETCIIEGARGKGKTTFAIDLTMRLFKLREDMERNGGKEAKASDLAYIHKRLRHRDVDERGRKGVPKLGAYLSDEVRVVTNMQINPTFPYARLVHYFNRTSELMTEVVKSGMEEDHSVFWCFPWDETNRSASKFRQSSHQVFGIIGQLLPLTRKVNLGGAYLLHDVKNQVGSTGEIAQSSDVRIQKTEVDEALVTMPRLGMRVQRVTEIPKVPNEYFDTQDVAANCIHDFDVDSVLLKVGDAIKEGKAKNEPVPYYKQCQVMFEWIPKFRATERDKDLGRNLGVAARIRALLQTTSEPYKQIGRIIGDERGLSLEGMDMVARMAEQMETQEHIRKPAEPKRRTRTVRSATEPEPADSPA
jgi:hypothetical protein